MNSIKKIKLFSVAILALTLLFSVLTFRSFVNSTVGSISNKGAFVIFFLTMVILIIVLFILIIVVSSKKEEIKTVYLTSKSSDDNNSIQTEKSSFETEDLSPWIAQMTNKILPQNEDNPKLFGNKLLSNLAAEFNFVQGLIFTKGDDNIFRMISDYAYFSDEKPREFIEGETLSGQVAKNKKLLNLNEIPEGYITILSGLGKSYPKQLIIVPIILNDQTQAIVELASFQEVDNKVVRFLEQFGLDNGEKLIK